jgi:hypothetical protein
MVHGPCGLARSRRSRRRVTGIGTVYAAHAQAVDRVGRVAAEIGHGRGHGAVAGGVRVGPADAARLDDVGSFDVEEADAGAVGAAREREGALPAAKDDGD